MLLLIDNYDSFTHNVARYLRELSAEVKVVRNDQISLADIQQLPLAGIVISPGPCTPNEAGISIPVIEKFAGHIPLLGVCLGHQAIGQVFGAQVVRAKQVMHGKISELHHNNQGLFQGLPSPFTVARYHSLVLDHDSLPDELIVDAWVNHDTGVQEVMGIHHESLPVWGVQYHPEAIETEHGHAIFKRFLEFCDLI